MTTAVSTEDRLIGEFRGYAALTTGNGMGISIPGTHLQAVIDRLDTLEAARTVAPTRTPRPVAPPPPDMWQAPLSAVLRIVAEILEHDDYADLCGVNLPDALQAWADRNNTTINKLTLTAVNRALSGE